MNPSYLVHWVEGRRLTSSYWVIASTIQHKEFASKDEATTFTRGLEPTALWWTVRLIPSKYGSLAAWQAAPTAPSLRIIAKWNRS